MARPVGGSVYAADIGGLRLGTREPEGYKIITEEGEVE